jgi:hypothetical protein
MRMRHVAKMHAGPLHVLVTIRDVSESGLFVETDYMLDIGQHAMLENDVVGGNTPVRVVRHGKTVTGRMAMGLEVISSPNAPSSDGSGLFRVG